MTHSLVSRTRWGGRRVLVTGATGIIGSWLVRRLLELDADVSALVVEVEPGSELVRSNAIQDIRVVYGRLEDRETLERSLAVHRIQDVFHLGAQTQVEVALVAPLLTFEANIRGTYNVLEACRTAPGIEAVVVASSDKAYGDSEDLPYREDMRLDGRHPYDVSKSCADLLARSYHVTYELPVAIARCGNVYGGGDLNWSRIVPGTIRSLLRGERPHLRSDGSGTRDYIFVEDVVDAYLLLGDAVLAGREGIRGGGFNFACGEPRTPIQIVELLQETIGRQDLEPLVCNTARGEILHQRLDSAKARELLDWAPTHELRGGLARTVEWYREYLCA